MATHLEGTPTQVRQSAATVWTYLLVCQAGWFLCVLGAARGIGWPGMMFAVCTVIAHLWRCTEPARELRFIAAAVLIGWLWETVLVHSGLLVYPHFANSLGIAPYWMVGLWALFAIQFNILLLWLRGRPWLAAFLGAVAGPLSFRAGAALGAVQFPQLLPALAALSLGWALLMPLMLHLAARWDGVSPR